MAAVPRSRERVWQIFIPVLAVAVVGGMVYALRGTGSSSGESPFDTTTTDSSRTWLTDTVKDNGGLLPSIASGPNHSASIEAALGLRELGTDAGTVAAIAAAVARGVGGYVSGDASGDPGSYYAAPAAKAAVLVQATGGDPTDVGAAHLDLIQVLAGLTGPNGRISDVSPARGDNADVAAQAYAVRALLTAQADLADRALAFLLTQQCEDGWFRKDFSHADLVPTDTACDADPSATPSVDATATAMLQLEALDGDARDAHPEIEEALAAAADWLSAAQAEDGSWSDGEEVAAPNAATTGLAARALGLWGDGASTTKSPPARAADWIRANAWVGPGPCGIASAQGYGAIAPDAALRDQAAIEGGARSMLDQLVATTAAAFPALRWVSASSVRAGLDADEGIAVVIEPGEGNGDDSIQCVTTGTDTALALVGTHHTVDLMTQDPSVICHIDFAPRTFDCGSDPSGSSWALFWNNGNGTAWTATTDAPAEVIVPVGGAVALVWQAEPGATPVTPVP